MPKRSYLSSIYRVALLAGLLLYGLSCTVKPKGDFTFTGAPTPPNYTLATSWAALPGTEDPADLTPAQLTDRQEDTPVDVFFIHPTTYNGKKGGRNWNGPIYDPRLNQRTDQSAIRYQATIFNGAGRVFAPRYRQAHMEAYHTEHKQAAEQAFDLAYSDIKAAFEYYLAKYNEGRPIIIAAHSQGTTHGKRLVREFFDGKPLQRQLVVAYLVGLPVARDYFKFIKVCGGPEEIGCFCTWRTWRAGKYPKSHEPDNNIAVTNPLLWTTTTAYAPASLNRGAVLRDFEKIHPEITDARVHEGLLWISKPRFPGSFFLWTSNYHIGDYNLFYLNVRENARRRVGAFLKLQQ